jgi:hypothetical protein
MKLISSNFSIPKKGNQPRENEDFFYPHGGEIRRDHQSIAIADGASEGFLSKLWSKILTVSYVNFNRTDLDIHQFTDFCIDVYEVLKGSFSTLLGVTFFDETPEGGCWLSVSVGDSCIFQLRDSVIESFPVSDISSFGNSPDLISSNPAYNRELEAKVRVKTGRFLFGDSFYLMTDAIAHWFMNQNAEGGRPWTILEELFETDRLKEYVDRLRGEGSLKNDDVTIAQVMLTEE